ncbi:MAG: hypothetical protein ACXWV3_09785 [Flavisolibacter sp.]
MFRFSKNGGKVEGSVSNGVVKAVTDVAWLKCRLGKGFREALRQYLQDAGHRKVQS